MFSIVGDAVGETTITVSLILIVTSSSNSILDWKVGKWIGGGKWKVKIFFVIRQVIYDKLHIDTFHIPLSGQPQRGRNHREDCFIC